MTFPFLPTYPHVTFSHFLTCGRYAILNECKNLVDSGVLKAEDVDTIMKDGLGMRYAWIGPLETAVLNANGELISVSICLCIYVQYVSICVCLPILFVMVMDSLIDGIKQKSVECDTCR